MKHLIFLLPFISFGQTWVMEADHKLLPYRAYEIDSIVGNGHTMYLQCGSTLKINKYAENVRFGTMRYTYDRCSPWNTVTFDKDAVVNKIAFPTECIKIQGVKLEGGTKGNNGNGNGKGNNKTTRQ